MFKKQGNGYTCGFCNGHDIKKLDLQARDITVYAVCQTCKAIYINGVWYKKSCLCK